MFHINVLISFLYLTDDYIERFFASGATINVIAALLDEENQKDSPFIEVLVVLLSNTCYKDGITPSLSPLCLSSLLSLLSSSLSPISLLSLLSSYVIICSISTQGSMQKQRRIICSYKIHKFCNFTEISVQLSNEIGS